MDPEYVARYATLYRDHWWWRAREALVLDVIERILAGRQGGRILDVGCGDGLFFDELQRFGQVEGIEPDEGAVSADGPWGDRIARGRLDESFAPEHRYSLILFLDVLEHVSDPVAVLRRALELLEPDGSIVVTVPAHNALWTSHDVLNHHYRRYTKASFGALAESAGARPAESAYFFHWLAPVKLGVRLKESLVGAQAESPGIPPRWVNSLLRGVSTVEQRTLTRLPIPFGTSLLFVLRSGGDHDR
jgi:SAM-dependent methyltransferase